MLKISKKNGTLYLQNGVLGKEGDCFKPSSVSAAKLVYPSIKLPVRYAQVIPVRDPFLNSPIGRKALVKAQLLTTFTPYDPKLHKMFPMNKDKLETPSGTVYRPNHNVVFNARQARLVRVVVDAMKKHFPDHPWAKLTENEILNTQLFSMFDKTGRRSEISREEAEAYIKRRTSKFKDENPGEKVPDHIKTNIFDDDNRSSQDNCFNFIKSNKVPFYSEDSEPTKNTSTAGVRRIVHFLETMRCFSSDKFLGSLKDAAYLHNPFADKPELFKALMDYERDLLIATGAPCVGHGKSTGYDIDQFGKCSTDVDHCIKTINNVPVPDILKS